MIAAVVAGAALFLAERQDPVYESEASVQFLDSNVDTGFLGATLPAEATPDARAATRPSRSASPTTIARVRDKLKTKEPIGKLRSALPSAPRRARTSS